MKKILSWAVVIILVLYIYDSCGESDKGDNKTNNSKTEQSENADSDPDWIEGTWVFKGIDATGCYTDICMIIDRSTRTIVVESNLGNEVGKYSISDNKLYLNGAYFELDPSSHRIGLGDGTYLRKK